MTWRLYRGDCLDMLAELDAESVDACVCDPPYGLGKPPPIEKVLHAWLAGERVEVKGGGFMGAEWDAFVPGPRYWREVARVLKPGGHAVVFAGQRTIDVMGIALRLAGLEVRDLLGWQYWSGFPKSLDVSKAIDRAAGAEREVVGLGPYADRGRRNSGTYGEALNSSAESIAPATPDAKRWEGWGTALGPPHRARATGSQAAIRYRGRERAGAWYRGAEYRRVPVCVRGSAWPGPYADCSAAWHVKGGVD